MQRVTRAIPEADWTVVRLRIGTEERRRRVLHRGLLLGYAEADVQASVEAGDADERNLVRQDDLPGIILDTDGLDGEQVVDLVLGATGWPGLDA